MLKRISVYLLVVLVSCKEVSPDLTTTLTIDPTIKRPSVADTDTTNHSECWNFESFMMPNSNLKSSDGNTLFYARAPKFKNQLKIILEGCVNNGHDNVTINIVDSSFLVVHTQGSGRDETMFTPIKQELTISKYPSKYGDTIIANLKYKGIAFKEKWKLNADFNGPFSFVITADTAMTYFSISDGEPAADYVKKMKIVGMEGISKIGQFKNLERLDITDKTYSGKFPSEILSLRYLEELDLSCNISQLPAQIDRLTNLKTLNLWGNDALKELPRSLIHCRKLKELNLRQNEGIILHSLKGFDSLQHLNLSEINLSRLPEGVTTLQMLQTLDLSGNSRLDFNRVFADLSRAKSLEELELRYCKLEKLPSSILELKNLKKINLSWNRLQIGDLQRLRCEMPTTEIVFFGEHE
jgi:Leucine-rich repeat (LRR) protein